MRNAPHKLTSLILAGMALILGGCTPTPSGQSGGQTEASVEPDTQGEESYLRSELDDYLGVGEYTAEERKAADEAYYQLSIKRQSAIAECMAEQGFEYKPILAPTPESLAQEVDTRTEMERAEQDGFDVFPMNLDDTSDPEWEDPNRATVDAMSESELDAWARALHGDSWDVEIEDLGPDGFSAEDYAPGCLGRAAKAIEADVAEWEKQYGGSMVLYSGDGGQWHDLAQAIDKLYSAIEDSPEMGALQAAWSDCMEQKGYRYKDKWEIMEYLFAKRDKIYGLDLLEGPDGRLPEGVEIPAPDPKLEAAAVKEERELAVADQTCREQVDYDGEYDRIRVAYENKFVEEHRELLEQYKAANQ